MKFKLIQYFLVFILLVLSLSCVEHTIFMEIHPDGKVDYIYNAHGDRDDLLDADVPLPKQKDWFIVTTFDDKTAETFDYSAQKRFLKNENIPHTFFESDSIYKESLLLHPSKIKVNDWFIAKYYNFECQFRGREVESKYPKIAGHFDNPEAQTGWQKEILLYVMTETIQLSQIGFNLQPVVSSDIQNWYDTEVSTVSDSVFLANYADYRQTVLEIIKSPLDETKKSVIDSVFKMLEDEAKITIDLSDDVFMYKVLLPGFVTQTNADSTSGDTLIWEFGVANFQNEDFEMFASSTINYPKRKWYILGFIAFLGLLLFLWYRIRN